jgi:hypothetical protein
LQIAYHRLTDAFAVTSIWVELIEIEGTDQVTWRPILKMNGVVALKQEAMSGIGQTLPEPVPADVAVSRVNSDYS